VPQQHAGTTTYSVPPSLPANDTNPGATALSQLLPRPSLCLAPAYRSWLPSPSWIPQVALLELPPTAALTELFFILLMITLYLPDKVQEGLALAGPTVFSFLLHPADGPSTMQTPARLKVALDMPCVCPTLWPD